MMTNNAYFCIKGSFMSWKDNAIDILRSSLRPVPTELNELDWKSGLSCKTERLAHHMSAFANHPGGGMFVFGVNDDGTCFTVTKDELDEIVKKLGNIAKNNLSHSIAIEHCSLVYEGHSLLFVYVPEQKDKPVYLRGKDIFESYRRSAKQTVKMTERQVRNILAESQGLNFEDRVAKRDLSVGDVLKLLNYKKFFELLDKKVPQSDDLIIERLKEYGCCEQNGDLWSITNLGALLFASEFEEFPDLKNRRIIVRKYSGANNRNQILERYSHYGYACGFVGLIDFIMKNIVEEESIDVTRDLQYRYPRVAIRELVVNAMVHQDFAVSGIPLSIEIFSNRLVITNPGVPLNDVNRFIDLPPHSRNEKLAESMFLLGICEKRGSGFDRAVEAVEKMLLPSIKVMKNDDSTRVTIYAKKALSEMTREEKIAACYQHACLVNEDGLSINNQSVRERFGLDKRKVSDASRIIADTLESGLIKLADADRTSKKYAAYIPFYG